jgi:polyisoprenoid-binding protein YceI
LIVPRFRVNPERSRVVATVRATLQQIEVEARNLTGSFAADVESGKLIGALPSGDFDIRVADLTAGNPLFDLDLRRTLDARKFPMIAGSIRRVEAAEVPGEYAVEGELRMHGVSRPVAGRVSLQHLANGAIGLDGEMRLVLGDFGIQPRRMLMMTVNPEVHVVAHVVAELAQ